MKGKITFKHLSDMAQFIADMSHLQINATWEALKLPCGSWQISFE